MFSILALKIGSEGDKISRKKLSRLTPRQFFSQNFVTLGADFESQNWKHDLVRLCFMLYTPSFGNSWKKWKFCNWVVRRRRPLWCQWRPLCGFGNFGKKFWIWEFFSKILKIWKFSKFWIKISKVGSKFWRWEGYMRLNKSIFTL